MHRTSLPFGLGYLLFSLLGMMVLAPHSLAAHPGRETAVFAPQYIVENEKSGGVKLHGAPILVSASEPKGVQHAVNNLALDFEKVTGKKSAINGQAAHAIVVGTLGVSDLIDELVRNQKINVNAIRNQWDAYQLQLVQQPFPGVDKALVIVGANKRGTMYGIYDLAEKIGVSPWTYWADVPVKKKSAVYAFMENPVVEIPKVKYRGIFLNDEAPALTNWVNANHGGYNHEFYIKVFELMLRLKANYLWPAMWNNAFSDDDPQNMILADEYGIVMGTSHHEPMMRADKEWNRYGSGPWDYSKSEKNIYEFWRAGAKRNKNYESIFTIGMRGQDDQPMSETENIELLEKIVVDQREILTEVFSDRDVTDVPQVWCLYKEVQSYYENGMRVPDDVMLLWSDDNWGNIRRLPTPEERKRPGGAGVYFHVDYVGMPRSYRWINTVPIAKIWEQMQLAYRYEANKIWLVNVGDLKPMEFPMEFFLRMAWNPEVFTQDNLIAYGQDWAAKNFSDHVAVEIEQLISAYTRHNGRRKPELVDADSYSLVAYDEANRIEQELDQLVARAEALNKKIPQEQKDAFFQLVLHPIKATAIVTKLHIAVAKNRLYADQGRANSNDYVVLAEKLFAEDAALKEEYHQINGGKWKHFMDQPHIGYKSWNNPEGDQMPVTHDYSPGQYAEMGVAVEGYAKGWPERGDFNLTFNNNGKEQHWFEIYNRGQLPFKFGIVSKPDWLVLSAHNYHVEVNQKIYAQVDWNKLPEGKTTGKIIISGSAWPKAEITFNAIKHPQALLDKAKGFVEADGYIALEAEHFSSSKAVGEYAWQVIHNIGRTAGAITRLPVADESFTHYKKAPYVEYQLTFLTPGEHQANFYFSPGLDFVPGRGLRVAIGFADEKPATIDIINHKDPDNWSKAVSDSVRISQVPLKVKKPGVYRLRIYSVDSGVTLQKIVIDTGGLKPSYLGPPPSQYIP